MKAFRVSGIAPFGSQRQKFSLDLPAEDSADAEHRVYSILGSRHNAKRRKIDIQSVEEINEKLSEEKKVLDESIQKKEQQQDQTAGGKKRRKSKSKRRKTSKRRSARKNKKR